MSDSVQLNKEFFLVLCAELRIPTISSAALNATSTNLNSEKSNNEYVLQALSQDLETG